MFVLYTHIYLCETHTGRYGTILAKQTNISYHWDNYTDSVVKHWGNYTDSVVKHWGNYTDSVVKHWGNYTDSVVIKTLG